MLDWRAPENFDLIEVDMNVFLSVFCCVSSNYVIFESMFLLEVGLGSYLRSYLVRLLLLMCCLGLSICSWSDISESPSESYSMWPPIC